MFRSDSRSVQDLLRLRLLLLGIVAVGISAGLVRLISARRNRISEITGIIPRQNHYGIMAFSPDGRTLALPEPECRGCGRVELWDLERRQLRVLGRIFEEGPAYANRAAFSQDGRLLAIGYQHDIGNHSIEVWDVSSGEEVCHIASPPHTYIIQLAFLEDGRSLLAVVGESASESRYTDVGIWKLRIIHWETSTGKLLRSTVLPPELRFDAISSDGRFGVFQGEAGRVVMELATGKNRCQVDGSGGFVFSRDGSVLVSCDRRRLLVWSVPDGENTASFTLPLGAPSGYSSDGCLALSADKRFLVLGRFVGSSNTVGLISLETGKVLGTVECCPPSMICFAVALSSDARTLVTNTEPNDQQDRHVKPLLRFWRLPRTW